MVAGKDTNQSGHQPYRPPAADVRAPSQEAALRDLVWRVEHVRSLLTGAEASTPETRAELAELLDTGDARAALGLRPCEDAPENGGENDSEGDQA